MICERCGKPRATEAEADIADSRDNEPAYTSQFCWDDFGASGIYCEDTRLERALAELERLRKAVEIMAPAKDGFGEWFDELVELGVLVEVPSDAAFREEYGEDETTMYVYAWRAEAAGKEADHA
jgi:hypothetical protein